MPRRVLLLTDEEARCLMDWYVVWLVASGGGGDDDSDLALKLCEVFDLRGEYSPDFFEAR